MLFTLYLVTSMKSTSQFTDILLELISLSLLTPCIGVIYTRASSKPTRRNAVIIRCFAILQLHINL